MKILVLGDIHGRVIWKDIIEKEVPDLTIFLGDYVSSHDKIVANLQLQNLKEILNFKESNKDKVILLRGNHDLQHLGYSWAECSGFNKNVFQEMMKPKFRERFLKDSQWVFRIENIIFSHAGISQNWFDHCNFKSIEDINKEEPSLLFGFSSADPFDYCGDSISQPLTWIRPASLCVSAVKGYKYVVGHTPVVEILDILGYLKGKLLERGQEKEVAKLYDENGEIWLCDSLPKQYLIIQDNEFIVRNYTPLVE